MIKERKGFFGKKPQKTMKNRMMKEYWFATENIDDILLTFPCGCEQLDGNPTKKPLPSVTPRCPLLFSSLNPIPTFKKLQLRGTLKKKSRRWLFGAKTMMNAVKFYLSIMDSACLESCGIFKFKALILAQICSDWQKRNWLLT